MALVTPIGTHIGTLGTPPMHPGYVLYAQQPLNTSFIGFYKDF